MKSKKTKTRERRRWLFRKLTNHDSPVKPSGVGKDIFVPKSTETATINTNASSGVSEQRHVATTTVSAVTEASPAKTELPNLRTRTYTARENFAAIVIQTRVLANLVFLI
ncbi:unnamed protein product [Arabis nemorensis]|uniref:Uncharacterized protein n=1 Tax=Arabis nemorensis TaxID=586526 RepID=A0A565C6G4_9BRAS|nr:unnamed protein product [Arabis nemorensis]